MKKIRGFTLVEMLIGMAILGVLLLAFTKLFGGTLRASSEVNGRNELIYEGQITQQLIASRLQNAFYIYPPDGTSWQLTASGSTTANTVGPSTGQNWKVNTDPFVAMLLPPTRLSSSSTACGSGNEAECFTYYAYYPVKRSTLIASNPASTPPADPNNADVWMLMEYRANVLDGVDRDTVNSSCTITTGLLACPPTSVAAFNSYIKGNPAGGKILVDYVQPSSTAPTYTLFNIKVADAICSVTSTTNTTTIAANPNLCNSWVTINLRLLKNRGGKALRIPAGNAPFATPTPTLSTRVYPRNWQ